MLPGRGVCAEIDPLLMIRPPRGTCAFIIRTACWAHRNAPVRLVSTTACQPARSISSICPAGPNTPALFTSRSSRSQRSRTRSNSVATDPGEVTSVGTASAESAGPAQAREVSASASARRPASATCQPPASRASAIPRPSPDPAPVTTATPTDPPLPQDSGNDGDRPPPGLDQPDRQRPDEPVPGLGGRAPPHGVRAPLVRHPPQLVVRVAHRDDERDRHAPVDGALLEPPLHVGRGLGERPLLLSDRPRARGAVHRRRLLHVHDDQ